MSQSQVAFLLGTRQSNISAYEAGTLHPGADVGSRIEALLSLTLATAHHGAWAGTLPSHAVSLRALLRNFRGSAHERDLLIMRSLIAMNDAFGQLSEPADQALFLTKPGSTGAHDVDVLLAGMAVHWCQKTDAQRVPAWTREQHLYLDESWWVAAEQHTPILRAQAFAHGVPSLRARGIFMDRRALASV